MRSGNINISIQGSSKLYVKNIKAGRGYLTKQISYSPVTSAKDLVVRPSVAAGHALDMPNVFSNVRRSMHCRCVSCIAIGGCSFEQLL